MNKLTLLLLVLIVGLALFLINFFVSDPREKALQPSEQDRGLLVKEIRVDSIDSISLKKGAVAVDLVKKDKDWIMPLQKNRTAKTDRITKLLADVQTAYSKGPRAGKAVETFELSPALRTEMTLAGEGKKLTLFVGKNLPESGSFVQRDANSPVLEVDKYIATSAGIREDKGAMVLDPAFFYDLKIFNDTTDDAIDVVIKKGNEVFRVQQVLPGKGPVTPKQTLEKDEKPIWWITEPEGALADESKVRSICSTVLNLTGKGYADEIPEKDRGFDKPSARILIRLKDGQERSMTFGKIDGDDVLVNAVGKPDAFKVNKYVYDTCVKTEDLKKKEEKKEEPEKKEEAPKPLTPAPLPPRPTEQRPVPVIPAPK